jgi:hypothetical protein
MDRGIKVYAFAKVYDQMMLEVVTVLFCLVVGEGILPGMVSMVP